MNWILILLAATLHSAFAINILPDKAPEPLDNPTTQAKVSLGKMLFFDPRLSSTQKVSCQTCHNVFSTGTDNLPVSLGINRLKGTRNSPTVWNSAFRSVLFWDGRSSSLEEQALGPLLNPLEMGMPSPAAVVSAIQKIKGYLPHFVASFGSQEVSIDRIAKAIAAYERTLITPDSPYDRFRKGDESAIDAVAKRGWQKFQQFGCIACHADPYFDGRTPPPGGAFYMKFPLNTGSEYEQKYKLKEDVGRMSVTHLEKDRNLWRVPLLRNIELTAPYFHNGLVKELDEAVRVMARVQLNKKIGDDEVTEIVSFLKTLTGKRPIQLQPRLPH